MTAPLDGLPTASPATPDRPGMLDGNPVPLGYYVILEIRFTSPETIRASDPRTGRVVTFPWHGATLPTQRDLANVFAQADGLDTSVKDVTDRRRFVRALGPFRGYRRGVIPLPIRLYDLGVGGCLIESHYPEKPGRRIQIDIDFPGEGSVTVIAETVYAWPDFGYAAQFVEVPEETQQRLERLITKLSTQGGNETAPPALPPTVLLPTVPSPSVPAQATKPCNHTSPCLCEWPVVL